jgi:hypothetical protein
MPALYGILISKETYIVCKWFSEGGGSARFVCNKHQRTKSEYIMLSRLEWMTVENTLSNDIVAINKTDRLDRLIFNLGHLTFKRPHVFWLLQCPVIGPSVLRWYSGKKIICGNPMMWMQSDRIYYVYS